MTPTAYLRWVQLHPHASLQPLIEVLSWVAGSHAEILHRKAATQVWNMICRIFISKLREMVEWCTRREINLGHSIFFSFLGVAVKQGTFFSWKGMTGWNIPSGTTFLISLFIKQQDVFGLAGTKPVYQSQKWEVDCRTPMHNKIIWLTMHPQHPPQGFNVSGTPPSADRCSSEKINRW